MGIKIEKSTPLIKLKALKIYILCKSCRSLSINRQPQVHILKVTNRASHNGPHLVSASFSFLRRPRTFFVRFFSPDANGDDMRTHFAGYKAQYDIINIIVCIRKSNRAEDVRLTYRNWETNLQSWKNEENHQWWQWADKNEWIDQEHKHPAFFSGKKNCFS